jgi:hypothetical protein
MKLFLVNTKVYKYSTLLYKYNVLFQAKDRVEAKEIIKGFPVSTQWAFDLTPIADKRTLKQIKNQKELDILSDYFHYERM